MSGQKLNNIKHLRTEIGNVFMDLREKRIDVHDAATLAKLADSMISSAKVELDYNKFSNTPSKISFLEQNEDKPNNIIESKPLKRIDHK